MTNHYEKIRKALAHEIWTAAQLAPGEGAMDGVARVEALLRKAAYPVIIQCAAPQQPAVVDGAKEPDLWRCTVCGRVGTVGRCCGEETRERANMEQLLAENERLRDEVEKLQEAVRPRREEECLTLDHWRMRAYYLEESWSRCSRACAIEQDKREKAEARAAKLEEALRLALKWVEVVPHGEPLHKESEADVAAARAALTQENGND